jgi:hypothetical protein
MMCQHMPPPPPPKSDLMPPTHRDITEAVRDTVTVRGVSESPRNRVGRSHTAMYKLSFYTFFTPFI